MDDSGGDPYHPTVITKRMQIHTNWINSKQRHQHSLNKTSPVRDRGASAAVELNSSVFWVITRRKVV